MAKRIHLLDSLRGIAAMLVVFHHVFVNNTEKFENGLKNHHLLLAACQFLSDLNHLAVLFFFVLSGFAIALANRKIDLNTKDGINYYLYRRFRRILPLYWLAIIFTALIGVITSFYWLNTSYSFQNLLGNLFFLQTPTGLHNSWFVPYGQNGPLWSLSYEMFFYLFFPIFFSLLVYIFKLGDKSVITYALPISIIISLASIVLNQIIFIPFLVFLAQFPVWLGGYYLGQVYLNQAKFDRGILIPTIGILCLFFLNLYLDSTTISTLIQAWLIFIIPGYLIHNLSFLPKPHWLNQFSFTPFKSIGDGSYAIYLMHYPLLQLLKKLDCPLSIHFVCVTIFVYAVIKLEKKVASIPFQMFKRSYVP